MNLKHFLYKIYYNAWALNASALSVLSHGKSKSVLPKCPYAATFLYIGFLKSKSLIIARHKANAFKLKPMAKFVYNPWGGKYGI